MPAPEDTVIDLAAPAVRELARPRPDMRDFLLGDAVRSFFLLEYLPELGSVGSAGAHGQRWWAVEDGTTVRRVV